MRIFLNRWFQRFALNQAIGDNSLCRAVKEAESGLVDADLGGGVLKQRIARSGEGKSGGFRTIILFRKADKAFYVYGYSKSDRQNITTNELNGFKLLAKEMLNYDDLQLQSAMQADALRELNCDE